MTNPKNYCHMDTLVAGAGAAGLFCALLLARGRNVALVESGGVCGRKLAISGGGRANFSNRHMSPAHYVCVPDRNFCHAALNSFTVENFLERLDKWRLPWEQRGNGRLFLKCSAGRLRDAMAQECAANGCKMFMDEKIKSIKTAGCAFSIYTSKRRILAKNVILALGSPARSALGATVAGWRIARSLGHATRPPIPALTPLLYAAGSHNELRKLAGINAKVKICLENGEHTQQLPEEELLFTHDGLSGPAILQASLYWKPAVKIKINFLPGNNFETMLDSAPKSSPAAELRGLIPPRLIQAILPLNIARRKNAELSRTQRREAAMAVNCFSCQDLHPAGMDRAEVCAGGVAVNEIGPENMESKLVPGLHIIGEMLDVTGELGGYNLHWAFASAWSAAQYLSGK